MAGESQQTPKSEPDPTVLTTEQLVRELTHVQETLEARMDGQEALVDERFVNVAVRFALVETSRVEQKQDTKESLAAALTAAKEQVAQQAEAFQQSVDKSEAATSKQLEQLQSALKTEIGGLGAILTDLKTRFDRFESAGLGGKQVVTERHGDTSRAIAFAGVVVAVFAIAVAIALAVTK